MAGSQGGKGNPASKRASSAHRKDARTRCWRNGQARKQARIRTQDKQATANRALRGQGEPTPWETACALRAERRAAAGVHERWLRSQNKASRPR